MSDYAFVLGTVILSVAVIVTLLIILTLIQRLSKINKALEESRKKLDAIAEKIIALKNR